MRLILVLAIVLASCSGSQFGSRRSPSPSISPPPEVKVDCPLEPDQPAEVVLELLLSILEEAAEEAVSAATDTDVEESPFEVILVVCDPDASPGPSPRSPRPSTVPLSPPPEGTVWILETRMGPRIFDFFAVEIESGWIAFAEHIDTAIRPGPIAVLSPECLSYLSLEIREGGPYWFGPEQDAYLVLTCLPQPSEFPFRAPPTLDGPPMAGDCSRDSIGTFTLRGRPTGTGIDVWLESGGRKLAAVWPAGISAQLLPDVGLFDENGTVVAREGDILQLGGTIDPEGGDVALISEIDGMQYPCW